MNLMILFKKSWNNFLKAIFSNFYIKKFFCIDFISIFAPCYRTYDCIYSKYYRNSCGGGRTSDDFMRMV